MPEEKIVHGTDELSQHYVEKPSAETTSEILVFPSIYQ